MRTWWVVGLAGLVMAQGALALEMRALPASRPGVAARLAVTSPVPAARWVAPITVVLDGRDRAGAERLAAGLARGGGRWLTAEEVAERFGASPQQMAAVRAWFARHGLEVLAESRHRRTLTLGGRAGAVGRAFGTRLVEARLTGRAVRVPAGVPELPASLGVRGVLGLDDLPAFRPLLRGAARLGDGRLALDPRDFAVVYGTAGLLAAGARGGGSAIAVVARSDFDDADVALFADRFTDPRPPAPVRVLARPDAGPGIGDREDELEALLDVEWASAVAPEATVRAVLGSPQGGVAEALAAAVEQRLGDVVSLSFGLCEPFAGDLVADYFHDLYVRAALQGQTVVVASGDMGSADCAPDSGDAAVNALAASPFAVAVGGSALDVAFAADGRAISRLGERVWNDEYGSGGGGVSTFFARPAYQAGLSFGPGRALPDLVVSASPATPGHVMVQGGQTLVAGGTSVGAPMVAGLVALAAGLRGGGLGHVLPGLYEMAASSAAGAFNDVVEGDNGFPAGPGFDLGSGWGSPHGPRFVTTLADVAAPACAPPWACSVPGRPKARGCLVEWRLPDVPLELDEHGRPASRQRCRDGTACDADGLENASCTFTVAACANVLDPRLVDRHGERRCRPRPIDRLAVRRPRLGPDPTETENRRLLDASLAAWPDGPGALRDACAPPVPVRVPVPLGSTYGRLVLRAVARAGRRTGMAKVVLVCERAH